MTKMQSYTVNTKYHHFLLKTHKIMTTGVRSLKSRYSLVVVTPNTRDGNGRLRNHENNFNLQHFFAIYLPILIISALKLLLFGLNDQITHVHGLHVLYHLVTSKSRVVSNITSLATRTRKRNTQIQISTADSLVSFFYFDPSTERNKI